MKKLVFVTLSNIFFFLQKNMKILQESIQKLTRVKPEALLSYF